MYLHKWVRKAAACLMAIAFSLSTVQPGLASPAPVPENRATSVYDPLTHALAFVGTAAGKSIASPLTGAASLPAWQNAEAFAARYAQEMGLESETANLVRTQSRLVGAGRSVTRYRQVYQGLPVFAGELVVETAGDGSLLTLVSKTSPNLTLDITPALSAAGAQDRARTAVATATGHPATDLRAARPVIQVYDPRLLGAGDQAPRLVWEMLVSNASQSVSQLVLVDAHDGSIALEYDSQSALPKMYSKRAAGPGGTQFDQAQTALHTLGSPVYAIYDIAQNAPPIGQWNDSGWPPNAGTTKLCDQNNSPASCASATPVPVVPTPSPSTGPAEAATNYKDFYFFFDNYEGRDGIDNSDLAITIGIDFNTAGSYYKIPYVSGHNLMYYGTGMTPAEDLAGHALTLGLLNNQIGTSVLAYQPGAINESLADMWGEFIEQNYTSGTDGVTDSWNIGENSPGGVVRNMADPTQSPFFQPDKMTSPYFDKSLNPQPNIFANAGVNNKAAYLMTAGGSFNSQTVTGLGFEKVSDIYYQTLLILPSAPTYYDLYYALRQTCTSLIGTHTTPKNGLSFSQSDCDQVNAATDAVEMNKTPDQTNLPVVDYCPLAGSAQPATPLFFDGFESGTGNWTLSNLVGSATWSRIYRDSVEADYHLDGPEPAALNEAVATMNNAVNLPSGRTATYLTFRQRLGFEYDSGTGTYFDGGVLEYSKDGGPWTDAAPLYSAGENYGGMIANLPDHGPNPLAGRNAFVGISGDYVPTRYDLTSLEGHNVKFRWIVASDNQNASAASGWDLDSVRIYNCAVATSQPVLTSPVDRFAPPPNISTLDWADSTPDLDHYNIQVSLFSDFHTTLINTQAPGSQYTLPNHAVLDPRYKYFWHVQAVNLLNQATAWSPTWSFGPGHGVSPLSPSTGPALVSPANNAVLTTILPDLDWADLPNTSSYVLQLSSSSTFSAILPPITSTASHYTFTRDLSRATTYYWRVRGNNTALANSWSAVRRFTTGNNPSTPSLISPIDGATLSDNATTLRWRSVLLGRGMSFKQYEVQLSTSSVFSGPPVLDDTSVKDQLNAQLTTPALTPGTQYFWRVRAYDKLNNHSGWSASGSFVTPPPTPVPSFPINGESSVTLRPTFQWSAMPGAVNYSIQVSADSSFATTILSANTGSSAPQYTPSSDLAVTGPELLYWRIQAHGNATSNPWTLASNFYAAAPVIVFQNSKSGDTFASPPQAGNTITYTITAQNTGDVALNTIHTSDPACDSAPALNSGDTNSNSILDIGETWSYSCTHTLTQDDVDTGQVVSNAAITSQIPNDASGPHPTSQVTTSITQVAGLNLVKAQTHTYVTAVAGDHINYTFTLTNTGNQTLNTVILTDVSGICDLPATPSFDSGDDNFDSKLEPSETWSYSCSHVITSTDISNGSVSNTAHVTSKLPAGSTGPSMDSNTVVVSLP